MEVDRKQKTTDRHSRSPTPVLQCSPAPLNTRDHVEEHASGTERHSGVTDAATRITIGDEIRYHRGINDHGKPVSLVTRGILTDPWDEFACGCLTHQYHEEDQDIHKPDPIPDPEPTPLIARMLNRYMEVAETYLPRTGDWVGVPIVPPLPEILYLDDRIPSLPPSFALIVGRAVLSFYVVYIGHTTGVFEDE